MSPTRYVEHNTQNMGAERSGGNDDRDEFDLLELQEGVPPMSGDILLGSLATMWEVRDPLPHGLVNRILVALAIGDLDVEYELLHLTERSSELVGTRGADDAITFTFDSEDLSMVLRVSSTGSDSCRVDGWITPARLMTVTATQSGESIEAHVVDGGRFEFPTLKSGATRFLLHPDSTATNLVTPAVDL